MEQVDAAEKEASEVLHSLLSVERIEKQTLLTEPNNRQVVVVTSADTDTSLNTVQANNITAESPDQNAIQWHTPVTVHHALFTNMGGVNQTLSGDQVIWQLNQEPLTCNQQQNDLYIPSDSATSATETTYSLPVQTEGNADNKGLKRKPNKTPTVKGTPPKRKIKPIEEVTPENNETSKLEESAQEVRERLQKGCECQEENCFVGLNPEYVYRHRLNIAELTKGEHDMYLMGVTMAVLTNPEETVRHKERRRLRAQYVFQGRRVCLDAFLYLENCTHYQLKRIRKHVMTHGVAPRIHGNHGKKPHNTFPLDSYQHAAAFLRQFIERHTSSSNTQQIHSSYKSKNKSTNKSMLLYLPSEITRKTIHNAYRKYCEQFEPSIKVMGYSTFRQYMKEQFSHVKFCKLECSASKATSSNQQQQQREQQQQQQQQQQLGQQQQQTEEYLPESMSGVAVEIVSGQDPKLQENVMTSHSEDHCHETQAATIINTAGEVQQVTTIPIVLSQHNNQNDSIVSSAMSQAQQQQQAQQPTTYIVTPVSQLLQSSLGGSGINSNSANTFTSYQLTPTNDYSSQQHTINQTQLGTITVASVQNNPYAFTTL